MSTQRTYLLLCALIALACALVASTYSVFGHTWDEPEHLAAGIALLDTGEYPYDVQHPPLARIAMAIGPYLAGARPQGNAGPSGEEEGRDILYGNSYDRYLTLARIGMLPFLVLLLVATFLWAKRTFDSPTALLSAALVVATPVVIGHAAVAALDIPMVGTTMLALYLLVRWFDAPTLLRASAFGIAAGVAAATKLSAIPFIGCVALIWTAAWIGSTQFHRSAVPVLPAGQTPARFAAFAVVAAVAAFGTLMLCYGFGTAPLSASLPIPVPVGIPRFIDSLVALTEHNNAGHLSYFMGELRRSGWWNFYVVALAVKTPLPLLLLALTGSVWLLWRGVRERNWLLSAPVLAAIAILMFCSVFSHINIGVRHVLVLYPLFAIVAAALVADLWRRIHSKTARVITIALLGWHVAHAAIAHPDYLADFNELAGTHPEEILIDSDLDWGQDLRRLKAALRERKIDRVSIVYRGSADLERENIPVAYTQLWPQQRATGWIAVGLLAKATGDEGRGYTWLNEHTPMARIGKSIDLYFIEEK